LLTRNTSDVFFNSNSPELVHSFPSVFFIIGPYYLFCFQFWDLNSGFMLARQLHYSTPIPFCSGYFGDRVSVFDQVGLNPDSLILCFPYWLDDRHVPPHPVFFLLRWGPIKSFFLSWTWDGWNHDPPDLSLSILILNDF
jgi:hypothetical protein